MNEERAVLDFFSQPENLDLALSVAEQVDAIRQQMNNDFWCKACARIDTVPNWRALLTDDRNTSDGYVGLHFQPAAEQSIYLRPMMEQQITEGEVRIYFGLMWNAPPAADKSTLPEIIALHGKLLRLGYKSNENFLAWRWTKNYPRSKSFLLKLRDQPDTLVAEVISPLTELLSTLGAEIGQANQALNAAGVSVAVSLDHLRKNLRNAPLGAT